MKRPNVQVMGETDLKDESPMHLHCFCVSTRITPCRALSASLWQAVLDCNPPAADDCDL